MTALEIIGMILLLFLLLSLLRVGAIVDACVQTLSPEEAARVAVSIATSWFVSSMLL